ncbi:Phospholipid/glycerol acyltransferase domain-containing protein [Plasmodiophora brassicae]
MPNVAVAAVIVLTVASAVQGIYEHEVGENDWYRPGIGRVRHVHLGDDLVIVATHSGVLAGLDVHTGDIRWRQVLADGNDISGMYCDGTLVYTVVTGPSIDGQPMMGIWNAANGVVHNITGAFRTGLPARIGQPPKSDHFDIVVTSSLVAAANSTHVVAFNSGTALPVYVYASGGNIRGISGRGRSVDLVDIVVEDTQRRAVFFDALDSSGTRIKRKEHPIAHQSSVVGISGSRAVILSGAKLTVATMGLDTVTVPKEFGTGTRIVRIGNSEVAVTSHNDVYIISFPERPDSTESTVRHVSMPAGSLAQLASGTVHAYQAKDTITLSSSTTKFSVDFRSSDHGAIDTLVCKPFLCAVTSKDFALSLIRLGGKSSVLWTRENALSVPLQAELIDYPLEARAYAYSDGAHDEFPRLFPDRLLLQLETAKSFASHSLDILQGFYQALLLPTRTALQLDKKAFNMRKIIVVLSDVKVYAICSETSSTLWSIYIGEELGKRHGIFLVKPITSVAAIEPPELVIAIGRSTIHVDPRSGTVSVRRSWAGDVVHVAMFPRAVHRSLLVLSYFDGTADVYPSEAKPILANMFPYGLQFNFANVSSNSIQGFVISTTEDRLSSSVRWSYVFPKESLLVDMASSLPDEPVADPAVEIPVNLPAPSDQQQKRVVFKYIHRGILAAVTVSPSTGILAVVIIDGVTGATLYHNEHAGCGLRPSAVRVAVLEHSVVYTFFSAKEMQYQIAVVDIYHNDVVLSQSYLYPAAICSIGVTRTRYGVAGKQIIVGLCSGQVTMIDRSFLDPRRPPGPSPIATALHIRPYSPMIGIQPLEVLSFNTSIARLAALYSAPTDLESASIVLAVGLDLFLTKVHPSRPFDLLNADFNLPFLIATVTGVFIAIMISSRAAKASQLRAKWA